LAEQNSDLKSSWPMRIMRSTDRRSLSRSATRALDVLEYFGQVRRPLRAVEIARRLSLHPSTVNQLLKTMVESAHLAFDATTKTYLPSPRLTRFSRWMIDTYGSDERLRHLIAHVRSATGEMVTLTTPNDLFMQVIDYAGLDVDHEGLDGTERGLRVSLFGSAIGAAYLSTLPRPELRRLAERARIPEVEHDALLEWVACIRREGFADGPSAASTIWSLAVPLPDESFSVPLVLGLAGPIERVRANLPQLGKLLRAAVKNLPAGRETGPGSTAPPGDAASR
jgi:DNA-binding IclR family transcriptional regulator